MISPASSVALAIALNLDGIAAGAALAGCSAHFAGLAFISRKENDLGGFLAQSICTPKVQLPNITKNPYIIVPTLISSAIVSMLICYIIIPIAVSVIIVKFLTKKKGHYTHSGLFSTFAAG